MDPGLEIRHSFSEHMTNITRIITGETLRVSS